MKTLLVSIGETGKIDVNIKGELITLRDIKNVKRAIEVEYRRHSYNQRHNVKEVILKKETKNG